MKTRLLGLLLAVSAATALAQGTIDFANLSQGLNAPVYLPDGTTKLSGSQYKVELMVGTYPGTAKTSVATTGFLDGLSAGYFSGGVQTLTGIPGGTTVYVQIRFWNTVDPNAWGQSAPFSVVLGDPSGNPPTSPAALNGLAGQYLVLRPPETAPGTINFVNWSSGGVNAPVYLSDGYTKASGLQYKAGLMAGPTTNEMMLVATTGFLSGGGAGYFNGGAVTVPTVPGGGTAVVQVIVWNTAYGTTYFDALASGLLNACGASEPFLVKTGDQTAQPPTPPGGLLGLTSFSFAPIDGLPVRPLPLFLERTRTNTIVLSWPFAPSLPFIEENSGTGWTIVGGSRSFIDTRYQLVLPAPTVTTFYRLGLVRSGS